jgi:hypothetical protein
MVKCHIFGVIEIPEQRTRPCPDNESCYPLCRAYGPYGGTAYWVAYTDSGSGP